VNYAKIGSGKYYASSFVGYFPADNPKFLVFVVHKPSTVNNNYYGADVAGPVLKELHKRFLQMFLRQMK
jgi:cell division protein FtsI (penicillin-binding protein 3)